MTCLFVNSIIQSLYLLFRRIGHLLDLLGQWTEAFPFTIFPDLLGQSKQSPPLGTWPRTLAGFCVTVDDAKPQPSSCSGVLFSRFIHQ